MAGCWLRLGKYASWPSGHWRDRRFLVISFLREKEEEDIAGILDAVQKPAKRGPYKKRSA
jgi:hypothetical protein